MADETHYVAQIKVERISRKENRDRGSANYRSTSRDVLEVTQLAVKAGSLEKLQTKIVAHVNLMDEDDLA